ncbi:hypothetical protein D1007_48483 [Hordeum vulgare]|nr:hypothetical protein D1007_48483 [Hordeum vulgare]
MSSCLCHHRLTKRVKPPSLSLSLEWRPNSCFFSSLYLLLRSALSSKSEGPWRASSRSSTGPWRSTGRRARSPSPTSSSTTPPPRRRPPRPTSVSPETPAGTSSSRPTTVRRQGGLPRTVGAPWSTDRGDRPWLMRRRLLRSCEYCWPS